LEYEIHHQPAYSLLKVFLKGGESVSAEAGAMVSMSSTIDIETKMKGGVLSSLKRSVLGGESFFINNFMARGDGEISFAPPLPGDIYAHVLKNQTVFAQSTAYIASTPGVEVDTKWGGAKTFFGREGLFLLKMSGTGAVFLSSYGAIHEIMLRVGERYVVDTGHMVAFEEGVSYNLRKVGGLKSTFLSGEGLVLEFTGPGKVVIQTRSDDALLSWLVSNMPRQTSSSRD
jgi:uncharacterized protein (TIGR00266 family)